MAQLSRRNFLAGSMVAAAGGASLVLGGCSTAKPSTAKSGQVAGSGSATGKGGELVVETVLENGTLLHINVQKSQESFGVGTEAMDILNQLIVDGQTLNVDTVSGATSIGNSFNEYGIRPAFCVNSSAKIKKKEGIVNGKKVYVNRNPPPRARGRGPRRVPRPRGGAA